MAENLETLMVKLDADIERFRRGLKEAGKISESFSDKVEKSVKKVTASLAKVGNAAKKAGDSMKDMGRSMSVALTLPVTATAGAAVKMASDVEEMQGKFNAVFQESAGDVEEWARRFGKAVGRSRYDLMEMSSSVQDTFVPLGFARGQAAEMAKSLSQLAVDVASFNNASESETMNLFTSALVGNHEAVRRYGIVITEATLKQELARMNADKLTGAALEQAKVQARLNLIMASTSDAHGDAARTSGSFANQMKALQAQLKDVSIELGVVLMPYARKLVEWAKEAIAVFQSLTPRTKALIVVISGIAAALGPALIALGFMTTGLGALATGFATLSKVAVTASVSVVKAVGAIAASIATPIGAVVTVLAAAGAAFYLFKDTVTEAVTGAYKVIKLYIQDKFNKVSAYFQSALYNIGQAWEKFKSLFDNDVFVRPDKTVADFLKEDMAGDIDAAAKETADRTKAAYAREMAGIIETVQSLKAKGASFLSSFGIGEENLDSVLSEFKALETSFGAISGGKNDPKGLLQEMEGATEKAKNSIKNTFSDLAVDVRQPIKSIGDSLKSGLLNAVNGVLSNIASSISGGLFSGVSGLLGFAGGGRVGAPAIVNERGTESLSQGKGLFVPMGGPATVVNAADTRRNAGGSTVVNQNISFEQPMLPTMRAMMEAALPMYAEAAAGLVMQRIGGRS